MNEFTIKDSTVQNEKDHEDKLEDEGEEEQDQQEKTQGTHDLPKEWRYDNNHPKKFIIGDPSYEIRTHSSLRDACNHFTFISHFEPKTVDNAEKGYNWTNAIQEELNQFERNNVWTLVARPKDHSIIETKWIFRNKLDEHENIVRNKVRLVAKVYN